MIRPFGFDTRYGRYRNGVRVSLLDVFGTFIISSTRHVKGVVVNFTSVTEKDFTVTGQTLEFSSSFIDFGYWNFIRQLLTFDQNPKFVYLCKFRSFRLKDFDNDDFIYWTTRDIDRDYVEVPNVLVDRVQLRVLSFRSFGVKAKKR